MALALLIAGKASPGPAFYRGRNRGATMRNPHRTFCGKCLKDFENVWALKRHYADCLRTEPPGESRSGRDSQSTDPSRATSATVRPSPIAA